MKTIPRNKKIELIKGLASGKIIPEQLQPRVIYFFTESWDEPGIYEGPERLGSNAGKKRYTEVEYQAFCKQVEELNNNSLVWQEGKTYENKIITIVPCEGCEPLKKTNER